MNEIVIKYHYDIVCEAENKDKPNWWKYHDWDEISIWLNGVMVTRGDDYHDKIFEFKEGFLLACTKLLTYHSVKEVHVADLDL